MRQRSGGLVVRSFNGAFNRSRHSEVVFRRVISLVCNVVSINAIMVPFCGFRLLTTTRTIESMVGKEGSKVGYHVCLDDIVSELENDLVSGMATCSFYIRKFCGCGDYLDAAKLLRIVHCKNIYLNPIAYHVVMKAAEENNDVEVLCRTFKDLLVSSPRSLTPVSYSIIAKGFLRSCVDDNFLLMFVKEVVELVFHPESTAVINKLIYCLAEFRLIEKALLIYRNVENLKCKPDVFTYNIVLDVLGKVGRVDEMLHEFRSMNEKNIVAPDDITYSTIINILCKSRRFDLCMFFIKEMAEKGLEPDLRTYFSLMENFGRSGNVETALALLQEMKKRDIRPSIYIYRSLISSLKKIGKLELAGLLSDEMNSCISDLVGPKDFRKKER